MTNKDLYIKSFKEVENMLAPSKLDKHQLETAIGEYQDCVFLKLYKNSWANPSDNVITSPSRIFFSVWINNDNTGKLFYNIHALKLRHLKGYKIESRKFADSFRTAFSPFEKQWPNVSTKFGPLTLMEGSININLNELNPTTLSLCQKFMDIQHLIDETLEKFRK
jgi:hypothetical protein